jgi:hypothetical protein
VGDRALFRAVAPRLELAHRQRIRELEILSLRRRRARSKVLELEGLVAHREMQLIRAEATTRARRDSRYMEHRNKKLQMARARLRLAKAAEAATIAMQHID